MLTDKGRELVAGTIFLNRSYSPEYLQFGLSLIKSNLSGVVREPQAGSYSRVVLRSDAFDYCDGTIYNNTNITFPKPTEEWGIALSMFVADDEGHIIMMSDLPTPKDIYIGRPPTIAYKAFRFQSN